MDCSHDAASVIGCVCVHMEGGWGGGEGAGEDRLDA